jgi:ABC-type transport system involved in multi-copper enzyme maturation permease subunit
MSPLVEIAIIARRELWRGARSLKGVLVGLLTLAGALLTSLVWAWIEGTSRSSALPADQFVELKRQALEKATGNVAVAAYLAGSPTSLFFFLEATVWLVPILVALLGFDAIAGELQGRSVRYWTVRVRRSSYFIGKFFGLWASIGVVALAMDAIAGFVVLGRGYVTVRDLLGWGLHFWVVALGIAGAWCALATLVSACFRSPMLSLLSTVGLFWAVGIFGLVSAAARSSDALTRGVTREMSWREYLDPSAYVVPLLSPERAKSLAALGILLVLIAGVAALGSALFKRRDI